MPENEHIYSDEASEIMGRMPSWIIRRGIGMIFIIFIGILTGCYFIKYPQTAVAPITITTINPPADLITRSSGRIDTIFVQDGQCVGKGDIVAIMYNTADYKSVVSITDSLKATSKMRFVDIMDRQWIDREYELGELQTYYADFRRIWLDYRHYIMSDNIGQKKRLLEAQIAKNQEYYRKLRNQKGLIDQDMVYEDRNVQRDSALHANQILSSFDFEQSLRSRLQKERSRADFDAGLTNTELSVLQMQQQVVELSTQQDNELAEYERLLSQSRQNLTSQIEQWYNQYVIASPIAGRVSMTKYWSANQSLQTGERLASVVPLESMEVVGRMSIPSAGFGKVTIGQTVNVKLDGFPYMEYGMLKGTIVRLSEVPDDKGYVAEVIFPQGMNTTYKKELSLIQQMNGTGEVITKDQRLIQRFLQPIRALLDK